VSRSPEEVWQAFSQRLRAFILARVDNRQDAEDILQEVYLKLHTNIGNLRDEQRLQSWLYRIASNAIVDFYRSRKPMIALQDVSPGVLVQETQDGENEASQEIAAGLKEMIAELPQKYRQALLLTEFEGLKQVELAERLDLSPSGARSRVQRGREMLRQALLDCCHFEFDQRGKLIAYAPNPACCQRCCV
jgi:RNA polymerase sigma-70 factor (ECF subfamily)